MVFENRVAFSIGTGRCGTKFLYELLKQNDEIAAYHERDPLADTFHRFCKWYQIDVDSSGFIETKRRGILSDLKNKRFSFESSAYLSFSVLELFEVFQPKIILLLRSPEQVINSYLRKGWYLEEFYYDGQHGKIPTSQPDALKFHHFLGRTVPFGSDYNDWSKLTRVGKLAWYWKTLNLKVMEQLSQLPHGSYLIQRIEDFDFHAYKEVCLFLSISPAISEEKYYKIVHSKPNSNQKKGHRNEWNEREMNDFKKFIDYDTLNQFGYAS